MLNLLEVSVC